MTRSDTLTSCEKVVLRRFRAADHDDVHAFASGPENQWNVRARSASAAALVVIFCLLLAGGATVFVLYRALGQSARDAAHARSAQIASQMQGGEAPGELDPGLHRLSMAWVHPQQRDT